MIEASDPFLTAPRISRERFGALLRERATPSLVAERDPSAYYDAIADTGVDPLFVLAMFWHESQFGSQGVAIQTRSWGNTRAPSFGAQPIGAVAGRTGSFPVFRDWYDGCVSTAARLASDGWPTAAPYGLRGSIRAVFDHPSGLVWAPAGDQNDPGGYLARVVAFMSAHADRPADGSVLGPAGDDDLLVRVSFIPVGMPNRPGIRLEPVWLTVHETANPAAGANAEAHRRWQHRGGQVTHPNGQTEYVSAHFFVDDTEAVQVLPLDEVAWHAGDGANGPGNRQSIAIETCVNADGDEEATRANLRRLLVRLCREVGIPAQRITQHFRWSGKDCPTRLRRAGWAELVAGVAADLAAVPENLTRLFPETGTYLAHGFLAYWLTLEEQLGPAATLALLGFPLSNELDEDGLTVQYLERAVLEYHPEAPAGYTVQLRRLGAQAWEAARPA